MSKDILRLRMFAGPNGSGKSTIKAVVSPKLLGTYVNPDDIEAEIEKKGVLDFQTYAIKSTAEEVVNFFYSSTLLQQADLLGEVPLLRFADNNLIFGEVEVNSYFASVIADFIRNKLLEKAKSFTFETVMSSPDKIELLRRAQESGYRTYLYYVATEDPSINISRVHHRVRMGGHPVPEDKVVSRYKRSLDLLVQAVQYTHRAYIFDNSGDEHIWLAEITNGRMVELKTALIPDWFKRALWDKFSAAINRT